MSRIRRVRKPAVVFDQDKADELLKSIATAKAKAKAAEAAASEAEMALLDLMTKSAVSTHKCGNSLAELVKSAGKSTNTVDPKALRKILGDEEYYQCISVSVTKAKEFVPSRELAAITHTTPGASGPVKLKVTVRE